MTRFKVHTPAVSDDGIEIVADFYEVAMDGSVRFSIAGNIATGRHPRQIAHLSGPFAIFRLEDEA